MTYEVAKSKIKPRGPSIMKKGELYFMKEKSLDEAIRNSQRAPIKGKRSELKLISQDIRKATIFVIGCVKEAITKQATNFELMGEIPEIELQMIMVDIILPKEMAKE